MGKASRHSNNLDGYPSAQLSVSLGKAVFHVYVYFFFKVTHCNGIQTCPVPFTFKAKIKVVGFDCG